MNSITEANRTRDESPSLAVRGFVIVYTSQTEVHTPVRMHSFNPAICLLYLRVVHKEGPMKGTKRLFSYDEPGTQVLQYREVHIIVEEEDDEGNPQHCSLLEALVTDVP